MADMEVSTCKHSGYSTRDIVYKEITSQQFALANSSRLDDPQNIKDVLRQENH